MYCAHSGDGTSALQDTNRQCRPTPEWNTHPCILGITTSSPRPLLKRRTEVTLALICARRVDSVYVGQRRVRGWVGVYLHAENFISYDRRVRVYMGPRARDEPRHISRIYTGILFILNYIAIYAAKGF